MTDLLSIGILAGAGLIGIGAAAAGVRAVVLARRQPFGGEPEPAVGSAEHLVELAEMRTEVMPAVADQGDRHSYPSPSTGYEPRHDEDTIGLRRQQGLLVPAGWMPPIGARRIAAALDETAAMPPVDEEAP